MLVRLALRCDFFEFSCPSAWLDRPTLHLAVQLQPCKDLERLSGRLWLSVADIPRPSGPTGGGGREVLTPASVCPPAMNCLRRRLARPNDLCASAGVAGAGPVPSRRPPVRRGPDTAPASMSATERLARRGRLYKKNVIPITISVYNPRPAGPLDFPPPAGGGGAFERPPP